MPWIGLTGVLGAGKSRVASLFRDEGALVLDADVIVRDLTVPGSPLLGRVVSLFGPSVLRSDGGLDRASVADIVFHDPEKRRRLENIIHPEVFLRAEACRDRIYRERADALVVFEAPVLFESGYGDTVDGVVTVVCEPETILRRAEVGGLAREEVRRRWAAQLSQDEKRARADWVIDNSGSPEETRVQVVSVIRHIKNRFGLGDRDG